MTGAISMASNMALLGQPLEAALQLTRCKAPLPTLTAGLSRRSGASPLGPGRSKDLPEPPPCCYCTGGWRRRH